MRTLFIFAALLAAALPAAAQPPAPAAEDSAFARTAAWMDETFRRYREQQHVPGLVWGIARDGRLAHVGTAGVLDLESNRPVTPDSLFRIASMSKAFTALAILKLRDEGRLSLDAPAEIYVPEMRGWRRPTRDTPPIRVRDLLHHVGGLVTDNPWGDRQQVLAEEDFTRMLREGVPLSRAAQTAFEYSNFGYALLGRIVTNVSGRPYADYIAQEIMRPLGMDSTGYEIADSPLERRAIGYRWEDGAHRREPDMRHGAFGALGGVQTSADDYARWIAFLLSAWPPRDEPDTGPVARPTLREMGQGLNFVNARLRPREGQAPCPVASAYAMGLSQIRDCELGIMLSHSGGYPGYGSYMLLLPEHGIGLFAFSSRTYAAPVPQVLETALQLHRAGLLQPRPVAVSAGLAAGYQAVQAIYRAGSVEPARDRLAMNFLMDRSAEHWARELARLRAEAGECDTSAPVRATTAMAGSFAWRCARGRIEGALLLAPTDPATIQELDFRVVP